MSSDSAPSTSAAALLNRVKVRVPYSMGQMMSRLHEQGKVLDEDYDDEGAVMTVLLDSIALERISRELPVGSVQLIGGRE